MSAAATFEEAFDRLYAASLGIARRLVGPNEAEDIAAEALTRAYVHWSRISDKEWCEAWVVRVTANLALSRLRRHQNRSPTGTERVEMLDDVVVDRVSLVDALADLSRRQRQIVILRYLADISEADVAGALRLRPVTVRTHARRALAALRKALTDDSAEKGATHG